MIAAGAALIEITPTPGLSMSGFAARTLPAKGMHDPLTVRAVVVNDTAIVVADCIGISADMSARICARCVLPSENVIVAALHNHGGPVSMAGRLSIAADPAWLERLEDACIAAVDQAVARRRPASLHAGQGSDPDIARNRRHAGGPVDRALPVLQIRDEHGATIAVVSSYACHPVVLGADNLLWTADYPHFVRQTLEEAYPGSIALFLTGCVGDLNTGHSAHASISLAATAERSFETAARIGTAIGQAALSAPLAPLTGAISARSGDVQLHFQRRETETPGELEGHWREQAKTADPARKALFDYWCAWARDVADKPARPLTARVTVMDWGGLPIVALPGEIFAETALSIRGSIEGGAGAFVVGFAHDNPGYIPPQSEFSWGGYEVDEAHRYYGQPATFAPGCAEALAECALNLARPT